MARSKQFSNSKNFHLYRTIYADPPWDYIQNRAPRIGVDLHYPAMSVSRLCKMGPQIQSLAHPSGTNLLMWATWPMLRDGTPQRVMDAWGWKWVSEIVWDKENFGMGKYARVQTEVLLIGKRGKPKDTKRKNQRGLIRIKGERHSEKPREVKEIISSWFEGPHIELFRREAGEIYVPAGWDLWEGFTAAEKMEFFK